MSKEIPKVRMNRLEIKEITQSGMNPWKKKLKRMVYENGGRYFISGNHCYCPQEINGKEYSEVEKVLETWFIK